MNSKLEEIANKLMGIPYVHNGRSYDGVDCWGLTRLFFQELGVNLPSDDGVERVSGEWYLEEPDRYINGLQRLGDEVGHYQNLLMLDIPYFRLYKNVITHSGVMLDEYHFIHVLLNRNVRIDDMRRRFWRSKYAGARRIVSRPLDN